jgi:hypothetical protein
VKISTAKFGLSECLLDGLLYIAMRGSKYPSALESTLVPGASLVSSGTASCALRNDAAKPRRKPHCCTCHKLMKNHQFADCPKNNRGPIYQVVRQNTNNVTEVRTYLHLMRSLNVDAPITGHGKIGCVQRVMRM